jgi:hypothetical protein
MKVLNVLNLLSLKKLDAAEALVKAGKLPMDAVIELENTNTVFNKSWQAAIEAQLQKSN